MKIDKVAEAIGVDFSALYDLHPEYVARREPGSFEQAQIDIEVRLFKVPYFLNLLPLGYEFRSVLEIGCATGELIAAMPLAHGGLKRGVDISAENIAAAAARFPDIEFSCGDFRQLNNARSDVVIMSDVLEHVPDDLEFLRAAAQVGDLIFVNLPLEDNWLNQTRNYGPDDVSGHLRKYSLADGLALFEHAGLELVTHSRVWFHQTAAEDARRALRKERLGTTFSGTWPIRAAKHVIDAAAHAMPSLGRKLYSSNLFALGRKRQPF